MNVAIYTNSDRLKTDGKYAFKYDAAGNLTEKGNIGISTINGDTVTFKNPGENDEYWQYSYDLLNRLIKATKNGTVVSEYGYDPDGLRVVKKAHGETTHYVFEGTEPVFQKNVTTGKIKSYVFALGKRIARVDGVIGDSSAKLYFYHTDQVGSVRAITDQSGKVVYQSDYFAYGSAFGKTGDFDEELGFAGKAWDEDVGMYYFNARFYDPELGRFISQDPAQQGNNYYSYCGNNPLSRTDPDGRFWQFLIPALLGGLSSQWSGGDFMQGFVMGALTGGVSMGVNAALTGMGMAANTLGTSMLSGAIGGGITSVMSGGDFGTGAIFGGISAGIAWGFDKLFGNSLAKWAGDDDAKLAFASGIRGATTAGLLGGDPVSGFVNSAGSSYGSSVGERIDNKLANKVQVEVLIYDEGCNTHFYGHADIAVGDTVYAYGRFDEDAKWGSVKQDGEGVLVVTNKQDWIQNATTHGVKVYAYKLNVSAAEAGKIEQFFKSEISKNGSVWKTEMKNGIINSTSYKFTGKYQTYHAFGGPNCATISMDALKDAVGNRMNWGLKSALTPAMVKNGLDAYIGQFSDWIYGKNKLVSERVDYK